MLVITTTDDSGESRARRLARLDSNGRIYVSAHHWPRGWYHRALENPDVRVEIDGEVADYVAVRVEGEEFERVAVSQDASAPSAPKKGAANEERLTAMEASVASLAEAMREEMSLLREALTEQKKKQSEGES